MKKSQCEKILKYMQTHKRGITPLTAMEKFGVMRLSGRIFDLKEDGYKIGTRIVEVKNRNGDICRVAEYSLLEK